eukprot:5153047-Pyramimonas_sp.AAC.1
MEGAMVDYHRPTTTKDDWGGWNGPFPVARNDPDRGQVIMGRGIAMFKSITAMHDNHHTLKS